MTTRRKETAARQRKREAAEVARVRAEKRRKLGGFLAAGVLALAATGALLAVFLSDDEKSGAGSGGGSDLTHVHGLGVNPKDGSLYIATHAGLFRAGEGQPKARRVGESEQDVMGFSVLGADRFLGSGHPGPLQSGPANLGLIRSDNGGKSWDTVSLSGEADFHVLRSREPMVYGFNASSGSLMVSSDSGQSWDERKPPGAMIDLAIDPESSARVVASTEQGLVSSADQGRSWKTLREGQLGLLAWAEVGTLYFIDGSGQVSMSRDQGGSWQRRGSIADQPAAFASAGRDLYAALPDGTVKSSTDGGRSWTVRSTP